MARSHREAIGAAASTNVIHVAPIEFRIVLGIRICSAFGGTHDFVKF
jgi:hypothetical protein